MITINKKILLISLFIILLTGFVSTEIIELEEGVIGDSYVDQYEPYSPHGEREYLAVGRAGNTKSFVKFNLEGLPEDADDVKLKLYVTYVNQPQDSEISVYQITEDWNEDLIYTNQPSIGTFYNSQIIPHTALGSWVEWDITELYNDWQSEEKENYGLALVHENIGGGVLRYFASSDNSDEDLKPKVVIDYTPEPECVDDSDCDNYYGENYCLFGNVYHDLHDFCCELGSCVEEDVVAELVEACAYGCADDSCLPEPPECVVDEDCEEGEICDEGVCVEVECIDDDDCEETCLGNFCSEGEVWQIYLTGECINPGSVDSYCEDTIIFWEDCDHSYCDEWEENYCGLDNNIYRSRTCYDAGCEEDPFASCYSDEYEDEELIEDCDYGCEDGVCLDEPECVVDEDCSEFNILEILTCDYDPDNNPSTLDFFVGFVSSCVENTCTTGTAELTHHLTIGQCGVECIVDDDCEEDEKCVDHVCEDKDDDDSDDDWDVSDEEMLNLIYGDDKPIQGTTEDLISLGKEEMQQKPFCWWCLLGILILILLVLIFLISSSKQ